MSRPGELELRAKEHDESFETFYDVFAQCTKTREEIGIGMNTNVDSVVVPR